MAYNVPLPSSSLALTDSFRIGLEFVRQYAAKGFKVIAAVRDVTTMPPIEGVQTYKIDATSLTDAHIVRLYPGFRPLDHFLLCILS